MSTGEQQPVLLQVLPALVVGGVERGTVDIARAAAQAGFRSLVASAGGPMEKQIAEADAEHITLPLDAKSPIAVSKNAKLLAEIINDYKVDILHARSRAPAWSAFRAKNLAKTNFITSFHSPYSCNNPLKKRYNSVMTRGKRVIAVSKFIAQHMQQIYQVPEERIVVIQRGVDLDYFNPANVSGERMAVLRDKWRLNENWPVVFSPGRITRWKGQDFLLSALSRLEKGIEYYCVTCGNFEQHSKYHQELVNLVEQYHLDNYVRIVPAVDDMPAAYMLADIVVSASQRPEGFGRVAAEAQAMGKPVVATDLGGSRETVIHGETGRLVGTHTSTDMSEGIMRGITMDATKKHEMAEACRAHIVENFSLEQMCEKTIALYREVIG